MSSLRRPLLVSATPLPNDVDVTIARLVDVPWSLHAFERMSLVPADLDYAGLFAELRAAAVMLERFAPHDRLVLLGDEVCAAFKVDLAPCATLRVQGRTYLHLPVPPPDETAARHALALFLSGPGAEPRCGVG
jgi:hypothetical protein